MIVSHQQSNKMKLFVFMTFNKKLNKNLLCTLSLIQNESTKTLEAIFKFLKLNFFYT